MAVAVAVQPGSRVLRRTTTLPSLRRARATYGVVGIAVLTGAFAAGLRFSGPEMREALSDVGLIAASLAAAAASLRAGVKGPPAARLGWRLMAAALASWCLGEVIWTVYEMVLQRESSFPSVADAAYLLAIPLACAALLAFPNAPHRRAPRARTILDAILIAGSTLLVSWVVVLNATVQASTATLTEKAIGMAYPLGDVLIASFVVFLATHADPRGRKSLGLIGLGLLSLAVADTGFGVQELRETYVSGNLIDAGWFAGYLSIGMAALLPPARTSRPGALTRAQVFLPYLVFAPAFAIGVVRQMEPGTHYFSFPVLVVLVVTVMTRQTLVVLEQRALTIERLRNVNDMKSAFLTAISHEVRTPMTTVLATIKTLGRDDLPPHLRADLLQRADANAGRLNRLLTDIADLNRAWTTGDEVIAEPIDAGRVVREVLAGLRHDTHVVRTELESGYVRVNEEWLRRIVEHLVQNALRYTPEGSQVWVRQWYDEEGLQLAVEDDGPGVPAEVRARIFRPLEQEAAPSHSPGMGLGLAIVARLATAHGGNAWIEDRPSGGACFRVSLPRAARSRFSTQPTTARRGGLVARLRFRSGGGDGRLQSSGGERWERPVCPGPRRAS